MPEKLLINKIWLNSGCGDSGIYREWENKRRIVKDTREIFQKLKNIHWGLRYTYPYFIPGHGTKLAQIDFFQLNTVQQ